MKNLIIIGASGFGREVFFWAKQSPEYNRHWVIKGFLDNRKDILTGFNNYPSIINSVEDYEVIEDDVFICAVGDPFNKKKYSQLILDKGGIFINLIHSSVIIQGNSVIGNGNIILANVCITCDVKIGNFVTIQNNCTFGHDVIIDDWCHINSYSFFGGYAHLHQSVTTHPHTVILPKISVGENSIIGAGSVVMRKVKPNITVFGAPAIAIL
jgi:sugar O-acyltransferase (sialic acid O-acetyltransferase NeuD family)